MAPSGSVLGNALPAARVDLRTSQILLADIFEAQQQLANATNALPFIIYIYIVFNIYIYIYYIYIHIYIYI